MKIIRPNIIVDSTLVSSSLDEDDTYIEWAATTPYTIGDRAYRLTTHKVYEAVAGGIDATYPEDALGGDTPKWIEVRSTNKWAMFNNSINDVSASDENISVTLAISGAGGLFLSEIAGESISITQVDNVSSEVLFEYSASLDRSVVDSFYAWFTEPVDQSGQVVITDLPAFFTDTSLSIEITPGVDGVASLGVCKFGSVYTVGITQYGATYGIEDYSTNVADAFGYVQVVERGYVAKTTQRVIMDAADFNKTSKLLASLRATPTVYIATEYPGYEPLVVFGYPTNFSIDVTHHKIHYCTLELKGMI